ncbi:MAG TPA: chemotaxis protein CheW [Bryobacteraceae bacterium]|nr:chemotaxis protein CheW [Bryobacteraceae bacterium]HPT27648.1 chemotaxis protein CheW [Bryobacteraceae bacterium]
MPDRLEHASDEEHGPLLDLPMGGLLSELLASEGADPADVTDASAERIVVEMRQQLESEAVPSPAVAAGPAAQADAEVEVWDGGDIAMPGLLADLIQLDQAARESVVASTPVAGYETAQAAGEPAPAMPESFTLLRAEGGEAHAADPASLLASLPLRDDAAVEPVPEADAETVGTVQTEPAPAVPEAASFTRLAIPELFSLLSAEPEAEIEPDGGALPELPAEAAPRIEDSRPDHAHVAGPDGAPDLVEVGEASADSEPLAAPPSLAKSLFAIGDELDDLYFEGEPEISAALPAAEREPGGGAEPAPALEQLSQQAELPDSFAPAAALAEAAQMLLGDDGGGPKNSKTSELTSLIDRIDGEIAASPVIPTEVVQTPDKEFERFVVFRLGGHSFGLHMKLVREVEKAGRVTVVPSAPSILRGLINLRGEILPLIDPRPLLGIEPAGWTGGGYLVVVQAHGDEMPVALLVDELGGVAPVDPASVTPVYGSDGLRAGLAGHALGQAEHRGRSVVLLDHRRLVTDEALLEAVESRGMELEEAGR